MTIANEQKTYALVSTPANKKIISRLETGGAKVILFPAIQTEKLDLDENLIALLKNSANFDWLIFFDVLSVDFFLAALEENGLDIFELDTVRVCALGEAVADRLRFVQIHSDVIPNSIENDRIIKALFDYIDESEIAGKKFLFITRFAAPNKLKNKLLDKGATIEELEVYRAEIAKSHTHARLRVLLKGGAIDEFVFSAPEDLIALEILLSDSSAYEVLQEINISAANEVIFQFLREHNLKSRYFSAK